MDILGIRLIRDAASSKKLRICKKIKTFEMKHDNFLAETEQFKLPQLLLTCILKYAVMFILQK